MKKLITLLILQLLALAGIAQIGQGALKMTITEKGNGLPIPFVNVVLKDSNNHLITGAQSDFDGKADLRPIVPGAYNVEISCIGYATVKISGVVINADRTTSLPETSTMMHVEATKLQAVMVSYTAPIIGNSTLNRYESRWRRRFGTSNHSASRTSTTSTATVQSDELTKMPARSPAEMAATVGGTYGKDDGSSVINVRGARGDANYYYIDGIKVSGSSGIPPSSIAEMSVITGGLPAQYEGYSALPSEAVSGRSSLRPSRPAIGRSSSSYTGKSTERYEPAPKNVYALRHEQYEMYAENSFESALNVPLSTFSIDVDQGSYTNARRIINSGYLPPLASVRMEEFINYFPYERVAKDNEHPFIADTELGACPWNEDHQLLKVTLQADQVDLSDAPVNNLVFLIDVSGSMSSADKLDLVKRAFRLLTKQLTDKDRVSIVTYAGFSSVPLKGAKGSDKREMEKAIDNLSSGGGTYGSQGIITAYELAEKYFVKDGNNRVILATDGDFNIGISDDDELIKLIEEKRKSGVFFTTLGFGSGNYMESRMEQMADHGNGSYMYVDSYNEARKVFLKELTGTLVTVAKDVKFQIEFNPLKVAQYRLLGYENRVLDDEDFADDTKDAGELGAGQMVTAFYEIVPVDAAQEGDSTAIIEKRYQKPELTENASTEEMMFLKIRYKLPDQKTSVLIEEPVTPSFNVESELSESFRFGSAVVEFALILRDSKYKGTANLNRVKERVQTAFGTDPEGYRREFLTLVEMTEEMFDVAEK